MSARKQRLSLAEAEQFAQQAVELLAGTCSRIAIAGSIRRRCPDVGDIELVCEPVIETRLGGLFGDTSYCINLLDERSRELLERGVIDLRRDRHGRPRWGSRLKWAAYRGVGLDLYGVLPPSQYGLLLVIRTGSAEFSRRLVTSCRWGGWLPSWMRVRDGALWSHGELVPTPNEEDVFATLGQVWVPPAERSL